MTGRPLSLRAFTLLELLTTIAIIGILAVLLLPALQKAHGKAKRVACGSNLQDVGVALHSWAHDHNDFFPMMVSTNQGGTREFADAAALNPDISFTFRHFQAISNELMLPKLLACPADKQRFAATNFADLRNENVSYWINPAAAFGLTDSPVAGDRNVRTSGRTEWTFIRFAPGDVVEFSAELHGYRGNVLFGDAHVNVLDARALRLAFASTNSADVILAIPRPDEGNTGLSAAGNNSVNGRTSDAANENSSNAADGRATNANAVSPQRDASPSLESRNRARRNRTSDGIDNEVVVVTRLDGTVVTSSVPQKVTNVISGHMKVTVEGEATNPIIQFMHWLTHFSARATYWLLLLLLLALIGFEVARRRGQRKRKSAE